MILLIVGLANALEPKVLWRLRQGTMMWRVRDRLIGPDGEMMDFHRRLERWCGVGAAVLGGVMTIVAVLAH